MKPKAILFDLDGTLIDSIPWHKKSFQLVFQRFGYFLSDAEINRNIFWSSKEIYEKLKAKKWLGLSLKKFLKLRRKAYYSLLGNRNIEFKERVALVQALQKRFLVGLVTNSSRFTTNRSTSPAFRKLFDCTVTLSDVSRGKPSPEMLLLAAKRLGVKPSECLYFGDSVVDVQAGRAARIPVVSFWCKNAVSSLQSLKREKPFKIVKSVGELERELSRLNGSLAFGD